MRRTLDLALLIAALALALAPFGGAAQPKPHFWLTVLHNNDGESQLITAPGQPNFGGIARFKTLVDRLKSDARTGPEAAKRPGKDGVVMLSSGDNFLAGPRFNASLEKGVPFYDSIGLGLVGYDAMALGNHEFDFGPDVLADFIVGFPSGVRFLSANLGFAQEPSLQALFQQGRIAKSTIVKERGERIGIVGATTPLLPAISSPRNTTVDPNVAAAVQAQIDALQARVTLSDFRGRAVVVTFIFASCLDTCPLLTDKMARIQDALGSDFGSRIAFVSITVDPKRDTPQVLKQYAENFGANLEGWAFLTGQAHEIHDVTRRYGVFVETTASGDINHTFLTSLIDSRGMMRLQYLGVRFDLEEFRRDLLSLLDADK